MAAGQPRFHPASIPSPRSGGSPSAPSGSVSRSYYDPESRQLFAAVRYPGEFAHIVAIDIDTGKMRTICDIDTPALYFVTSLAYDESSGTLFYTTNNARGWRNLNAVDIATGETRRLVKWARTGDLAFNRADDSLWGIMHHNGLSHIVRIPPPYDADVRRPAFVLPAGLLRHRRLAGRPSPDRHPGRCRRHGRNWSAWTSSS